MLEVLKRWYAAKFSDPDNVTLFLLLLSFFAVLLWVGHILVPVLVAISIAYLLEWPVSRLVNVGVGRTASVSVVMILFVGIATGLVIGLLPVVWQQGSNLINDAPDMIAKGKQYVLSLPEKYPQYLDAETVSTLLKNVDSQALGFIQQILSGSLSKLADLVALLIYLILVPLMIFFMLKDKTELLTLCHKLLPKERRLINQVGAEMNQQIMNYIRGKIIEIFIVGASTYVVLAFFGMEYAALLGLLVGLSVLIPYIGAAVVTIPVVLIGLFQFGVGSEFWYVMIAYAIVQALDGNLLVPLLFSEAVDLNPVFIIIAVLFFGGIFGFWGVFFAIPLASLVKAVIKAWSSQSEFIQEKTAIENLSK